MIAIQTCLHITVPRRHPLQLLTRIGNSRRSRPGERGSCEGEERRSANTGKREKHLAHKLIIYINVKDAFHYDHENVLFDAFWNASCILEDRSWRVLIMLELLQPEKCVQLEDPASKRHSH